MPLRSRSPSPHSCGLAATVAEPLPQAVLAAGERDKLWRCLQTRSPVVASYALYQHQQQQQLRESVDKELRTLLADGGRHVSALQDELSAGQLFEQRLQRYSSFVSFMGVQHNWRGRALAARTSR